MYITLKKSKKTLLISNVMCTRSRCDSHYEFQSGINVIHLGTQCISHQITLCASHRIFVWEFFAVEVPRSHRGITAVPKHCRRAKSRSSFSSGCSPKWSLAMEIYLITCVPNVLTYLNHWPQVHTSTLDLQIGCTIGAILRATAYFLTFISHLWEYSGSSLFCYRVQYYDQHNLQVPINALTHMCHGSACPWESCFVTTCINNTQRLWCLYIVIELLGYANIKA